MAQKREVIDATHGPAIALALAPAAAAAANVMSPPWLHDVAYCNKPRFLVTLFAGCWRRRSRKLNDALSSNV